MLLRIAHRVQNDLRKYQELISVALTSVLPPETVFELTAIHSSFWKSTQNLKLSPGCASGAVVVLKLAEEPALLVGVQSVLIILYPYIRVGTPSIVILSCMY